MVDGIRTRDPHELNIGCGLKFCVGPRVQHTLEEILEDISIYNNKDEDRSLNDKNHLL